MQEQCKKRGRPPGIAREGTYGLGVKTKVVRLPIELANRAVEIIDTLDSIQSFIHAWEQECEEHKTSPRYDKALAMLSELKDLMR